MKRIVTLQDISCVGSCSITVALPIITAMGVECGILPTAVLSTHTMFQHFTCVDLSDQITPISEAWKKEGIDFDGIYTGYLASAEQCAQVCDFFDQFRKKDTFILVDPAMADNGKLYQAFDEEFPMHMAKVCAKADIIVPNITEAALLTGMPYRTEYDRQYISELLTKLLNLGCKAVAITGVSYEKDRLGVVSMDQEGNMFEYFRHRCEKSFHGTGDTYSSVVLGGLMRGMQLEEALKLATDFVVHCIEQTIASDDSRTYAVSFQPEIAYLCKELETRLEK